MELMILRLISPLVFGDYPEIVKTNVGERLPVLSGEEREKIKGAFEFIGVNHYYTIYVKDNPSISTLQRGGLLVDMAADMICKFFFFFLTRV